MDKDKVEARKCLLDVEVSGLDVTLDQMSLGAIIADHGPAVLPGHPLATPWAPHAVGRLDVPQPFLCVVVDGQLDDLQLDAVFDIIALTVRIVEFVFLIFLIFAVGALPLLRDIASICAFCCGLCDPSRLFFDRL